MDTLIINGDHCEGENHLPVTIFSIDEACQRVRLTLSAVKGSFWYDRDFGADFSSLALAEERNKTARLLCQEALVNQKEISLGNVYVQPMSGGRARLNVEVKFNGQTKIIEVIVYADL